MVKKVQSWESVQQWAGIIAERASAACPDVLIGIGTGGYIPLALIAKKLDHRVTRIVNLRSFVGDQREKLQVEYFPFHNGELTGRTVLLIDDIVASGATMVQAKKMLTDLGATVITAALVVSAKVCPPEAYPDLFGEAILRGDDEFLCFPWD